MLLLLEDTLIASSSSVDLLMQLINRIQIFQYLGQITQSSQE